MLRMVRVLSLGLGIASIVSCGAGDQTSTGSAESTVGSASQAPTPTGHTSATASTTAPVSAPPTTLPASTTTSLAAVPEVETLEGRPVPAGEIVVGPDDLFVSHAEGDLWLYPGMLSDSPAEPYRVVDVGDPREPETEGPGPNQVDHVAGVFNGSVIYGDCCEPIAGNVLLAPRADSDRIDWIHGYTPSVSPDGTRLVTAAVDTLSVVELSTGAHRSRALNELGRSNVNVWGVSWATDSSVVVLYFDDSGFALAPYDADSLRQSAPPTSLDVAFDPEAPSFPSFAGHGRNGEVALAASDETSAVIRFFDAATLAERSEQKRVVPNGAEFIRLAEDGIGMLWMEDDRLWYHPAGGGPRTLGTGYIAAWFAL